MRDPISRVGYRKSVVSARFCTAPENLHGRGLLWTKSAPTPALLCYNNVEKLYLQLIRDQKVFVMRHESI